MFNHLEGQWYQQPPTTSFCWANPCILNVTLSPLYTLLWRHNGRDCVSNHQPHDFLLNQTQIKENIKAPRQWPLCGEFTGTGEFPTQMASNAEKVWWRHHVQNIVWVLLLDCRVNQQCSTTRTLLENIISLFMCPIILVKDAYVDQPSSRWYTHCVDR